ncbi:MAG TPA: hypothetical protein VMV94_13700, partial [Phycisphaerae bacterium]|nr:hypothetical protein [Phycisphaerae bacterium]
RKPDARGVGLLGQQLAFLAGEKPLRAFEFRLTQPGRKPVFGEDFDDFAESTNVTEMLLR